MDDVLPVGRFEAPRGLEGVAQDLLHRWGAPRHQLPKVLTLEELGVPLLPGPFKDFLDPWGNRIELIDYATIQFSKTPQVLRGMGLDELTKTDEALAELHEKGMAPD